MSTTYWFINNVSTDELIQSLQDLGLMVVISLESAHEGCSPRRTYSVTSKDGKNTVWLDHDDEGVACGVMRYDRNNPGFVLDALHKLRIPFIDEYMCHEYRRLACEYRQSHDGIELIFKKLYPKAYREIIFDAILKTKSILLIKAGELLAKGGALLAKLEYYNK